MEQFFAVDLGATSGRTLVGKLNGQTVEWEELTRFPNPIYQMSGRFFWDIYALYGEVIRALRLVAERKIAIRSIGIDTWGVDFVCFADDGLPLRQPRSYRDPATFSAMNDYLQNQASREKVYEKSGIQVLNFNTLFQLHAMRREGDAALRHARRLLFVPDALAFMLTGNAVCERTIASTSQLMNPRTGRFDDELLASVGLSADHFGTIVEPGTTVGTLTDDVMRQTGLGKVPVIAVASHDTASAVAAVPALDSRFAYLSSGTWSLIGIENGQPIINQASLSNNFTNEGGIDNTVRFLKNISGMWLLERCRKEWNDAPRDYGKLFADAMKARPFQSIINPDDAVFANPASMVSAICDYCEGTKQHVPQGYAEQTRCILESLALRYRQVFSLLRSMSPFSIDTLHIIGGGSRNEFLNQFTANSLGIGVVAGPTECTALGNIMVQARAAGSVTDIWQMRKIVANSVTLQRFEPQNRADWDVAYERFINL